MSDDTLYFGTASTLRTRPVRFTLHEERRLTVDLSAYCGLEDVTIESATWAVLDADPMLAVESPVTGPKTTSALVAAADIGTGAVQCSVVLSNAEVVIFLFRVSSTDPQYRYGPVDRYESVWGSL